MTGFAVDVAALQGLPPLLDRLGQDAAAGKQYLQDNTTIEYGVGLLNTVKGNQCATRRFDTSPLHAGQTRREVCWV